MHELDVSLSPPRNRQRDVAVELSRAIVSLDLETTDCLYVDVVPGRPSGVSIRHCQHDLGHAVRNSTFTTTSLDARCHRNQGPIISLRSRH